MQLLEKYAHDLGKLQARHEYLTHSVELALQWITEGQDPKYILESALKLAGGVK